VIPFWCNPEYAINHEDAETLNKAKKVVKDKNESDEEKKKPFRTITVNKTDGAENSASVINLGELEETSSDIYKREKMEEKEETKKADGLEAKIDKMIGILEQLVSSDKKVHSEMEKSLTDGKPAPMTEEEAGEKREIEKKAGPIPAVDPAEFSKAMTTIAALQARITELEGMTVQKSAVIIQSEVQTGDKIESTADAICKAEAESKKGGLTK